MLLRLTSLPLSSMAALLVLMREETTVCLFFWYICWSLRVGWLPFYAPEIESMTPVQCNLASEATANVSFIIPELLQYVL